MDQETQDRKTSYGRKIPTKKSEQKVRRKKSDQKIRLKVRRKKKSQHIENDENCNFSHADSNYQLSTGLDEIF